MSTAPRPPLVDNVCDKSIALLTASLTRVVGDQNKSAAILKRMHKHTIKKDREKKEKSKDWHEVTKKVILYAASVDGLTPKTNIPTTLQAIINARSIEAAEAPNTELANQMHIMGLEEVGWHISFTHNLRNGQVLYTQVGVPSNLSIFLLRLNDPTRLNKQQAKGIKLHLLKVGKENNKNALEMVKAGKNQIYIPTNFKDMLTLSKEILGISAMVFGPMSSLTLALKAFCKDVESRQMAIKAKICNDPALIAKILFAIDTCTQLWLGGVQSPTDQEEMRDDIINFLQLSYKSLTNLS